MRFFVTTSMPRLTADYVFDEFEISARRMRLTRAGTVVALGSRALDILWFLLRLAGEPVGKEAIPGAAATR